MHCGESLEFYRRGRDYSTLGRRNGFLSALQEAYHERKIDDQEASSLEADCLNLKELPCGSPRKHNIAGAEDQLAPLASVASSLSCDALKGVLS